MQILTASWRGPPKDEESLRALCPKTDIFQYELGFSQPKAKKSLKSVKYDWLSYKMQSYYETTNLFFSLDIYGTKMMASVPQISR